MLQCIVHGQSIYRWGKRAVLEIHNSVQCDRKHFKTIYETTNCLSFSNIFGKLIFFCMTQHSWWLYQNPSKYIHTYLYRKSVAKFLVFRGIHQKISGGFWLFVRLGAEFWLFSVLLLFLWMLIWNDNC